MNVPIKRSLGFKPSVKILVQRFEIWSWWRDEAFRRRGDLSCDLYYDRRGKRAKQRRLRPCIEWRLSEYEHMSRPNETTHDVSRSGAYVCLERLGGDEETRRRGGGDQESNMEGGSDEKVRRDGDGGDDENTDTRTEDNDVRNRDR
ncbi:hypothetical protein HID58_020579 [Brassica napus]|uniref:Uncharacterized protein n=2 Tax=Brassica napus TaxID=3708 RepID=A0ABQ8CU41_BRANA|nr:hypothetical protein HID58_020579 [Brassica napus]